MDYENDDYCSSAFRSMCIRYADSSLTPCCMYTKFYDEKNYTIKDFDEWWSTGLSKLRQQFKNHEHPPGCAPCFDPKYRQTIMVKTEFTKRCDEDNIPRYEVSEYPEHVEISFGNICNLKCIMCNSLSSSKIETEYKKHKNKFNAIDIWGGGQEPDDTPKYAWWENQDTLDKIKLIVSKAKIVNFSGGEPLMTPQVADILDVPSEVNDCFTTIDTNLTTLTPSVVDALKRRAKSWVDKENVRHSNVRVSVSLDGVGKHHEYIRHGAKWDDIHNNINTLETETNVDIWYSYLLGHTSLFTFPDFWEYFKNKNLTDYSIVRVGTINTPERLAINSALPRDVENFREWFEKNETPWDDIINFWLSGYEFDPKLHEDFKNYISLLDNLRGCDYHSTFNTSW